MSQMHDFGQAGQAGQAGQTGQTGQTDDIGKASIENKNVFFQELPILPTPPP